MKVNEFSKNLSEADTWSVEKLTPYIESEGFEKSKYLDGAFQTVGKLDRICIKDGDVYIWDEKIITNVSARPYSRLFVEVVSDSSSMPNTMGWLYGTRTFSKRFKHHEIWWVVREMELGETRLYRGDFRKLREWFVREYGEFSSIRSRPASLIFVWGSRAFSSVFQNKTQNKSIGVNVDIDKLRDEGIIISEDVLPFV
jgi:hypothetical protein